jgi:uncharacterized protein (TIGR00369 family)
MESVVDNPDRAFLERAIAESRFDIPWELTPGLAALSARLIQAHPGAVELSYEVSETAIQGNGVVAGGTLMTMLDYAMAFAVLSKLSRGQTCATTSITVNMQAAAKPSRLKVSATVERVGRQVAFARAELFDPMRELLIASASASFFVMAVASTRVV